MSGTRRSMLLLIAGAIGLSACGGSAGLPRDAVALVTPLSLGPPPIYALIGYRQELELTSEQIAALDEIAQRLEEENEPLIEELQKNTRQSRSRGQLVVRTEGEELLKQIRENQRKAVEEVEALLTEEQKAEVCRLYGERRGGGDRAADRERASRRVANRDTAAENRVVRPIGWQWCSEDRSDRVREMRAG